MVSDCAKEFDVTSVGKSHSLLDKFTKDNDIEKEEPISEQTSEIEKDIEDDFDFEMEM